MNSGSPQNPFAPPPPSDSPFAIVPPAADAESSTHPFVSPPRDEWPFNELEPSEAFGFEAPVTPGSQSPWMPSATPAPASPSPFSLPSKPQETAAQPAFQASPPATNEPLPTPQEPVAPASALAQKPAPPQPDAPAGPVSTSFAGDSPAIRQLELRAIFGMDREMDAREILDRCRALPRIRNLARIRPEDVATIESLTTMMAGLGFGGGALKLQIGSLPLEFIREGRAILAVQAEGGFAPGVRETLIIAARELAKMA